MLISCIIIKEVKMEEVVYKRNDPFKCQSAHFRIRQKLQEAMTAAKRNTMDTLKDFFKEEHRRAHAKSRKNRASRECMLFILLKNNKLSGEKRVGIGGLRDVAFCCRSRREPVFISGRILPYFSPGIGNRRLDLQENWLKFTKTQSLLFYPGDRWLKQLKPGL